MSVRSKRGLLQNSKLKTYNCLKPDPIYFSLFKFKNCTCVLYLIIIKLKVFCRQEILRKEGAWKKEKLHCQNSHL